MDDWRLLRQYLDHGSQAAFARLVDRHMRMVYWTCRREVADDQSAEDATQTVFVRLAHRAASLKPSVSITSWLFTAARFASRETRRSQTRRRHYEEEAARQMEQTAAQEAGWQQLAPWLNEGLSRLPELDRDVILLRYFEGLSFGEVALATGITEPAAKMRLSRALTRLRENLGKRDVSVSSILLPAFLAEHGAAAPPSTCQASVMQALRNMPPPPAVHPIHTFFAKGVLTVSTTKIAVAGGSAAVVLLIILAFFAAHRVHSLPENKSFVAGQSIDSATEQAVQQIQTAATQVTSAMMTGDVQKREEYTDPVVWKNMQEIRTKQLAAMPPAVRIAMRNSQQSGDAAMHQLFPSGWRIAITRCDIAGNSAVVRGEVYDKGTRTVHLLYGGTFVHSDGKWLATYMNGGVTAGNRNFSDGIRPRPVTNGALF